MNASNPARAGAQLSTYPMEPSGVPPWEDSFGRYTVSFARSPAELDEVLRLRFEVFNVELGHGESNDWNRRDEDVFDASCHHLLVRCQRSGEVVGTYRLMTQALANAGPGFYSDGEFDLAELPTSVVDHGVELGRACIARAHRGRRVIFLLWRGIGHYLEHNQKRFLFGCASIPELDANYVEKLRIELARGGHISDGPWIEAREGYRLADREAPRCSQEAEIPGLMRGYLQLGAEVCGGPAFDLDFGTSDFLMVLDSAKIPPESYRRYVR